MKNLFFPLCVLMYCLFSNPFQINKKLSPGINMGNMLETPTEGVWEMALDKGYFDIIKNRGFNSVRIPVRWTTEERAQVVSPYTINKKFLERVTDVVNSAISNGLIVVLNFHHYEALYENPDKEYERFLSLWRQVANHFKDVSNDWLIFEILNEPHGNLVSEKWNKILAGCIKEVRFSNPLRTLVIDPPNWGGLDSLNLLDIPVGETNVILSVHHYLPFAFTHQGASWVDGADKFIGSRWRGDYFDKLNLKNQFNTIADYSKKNNRPIYVGEFGVYEKADYGDRVLWTEYSARLMDSLGFSWAYWEFCAGFGAYDSKKKHWKKSLVDALLLKDFSVLKNEKVSLKLGYNLIKNSSFSNDLSEWHYGAWNGRAGFTVSNGQVKVVIGNPGTFGWNIQLIQKGIVLERGSYLVTFSAGASAERIISVGVENSESYLAYGALKNIKLSAEMKSFVFKFVMTQGDKNCRISFNFGGEMDTVFLDDIELCKVK